MEIEKFRKYNMKFYDIVNKMKFLLFFEITKNIFWLTFKILFSKYIFLVNDQKAFKMHLEMGIEYRKTYIFKS